MQKSTTRRGFLQTSAAGLWVVGSGANLFGRSANEIVNVACIGVGNQGALNLFNISRVTGNDKSIVNIVALCDVDDDRLATASKLFPKAAKFSDFRKMLDDSGRQIDAVVISTPDHTHAVAAMAAMKMGKHVYCEKPLAHSIHEVRTLTETARRMKVATQMGNQGQSGDNTRRIVEIVRSGAIGAVKEVHAWTDRPIWPQGMLAAPEGTPAIPKNLHWDEWIGPAQMRPYYPDYAPFKWRGWWDFGTGALGDMACHILNAAFWALDLKYPTSIEAEGSPRSLVSGPKAETIIYQFPARGELPPVTLTWYDGGRKPPAHLLPEGETWTKGGSLLVGEKGKLSIPDDYGGKHVLWPKQDFEGYKNPPATLPRSPGHHKDFIEACKDPIGRPACSDFAYSGPLSEVVLLGVVAFRMGRKIDWDGVGGKVIHTSDADPLINPPCRDGWAF